MQQQVRMYNVLLARQKGQVQMFMRDQIMQLLKITLHGSTESHPRRSTAPTVLDVLDAVNTMLCTDSTDVGLTFAAATPLT